MATATLSESPGVAFQATQEYNFCRNTVFDTSRKVPNRCHHLQLSSRSPHASKPTEQGILWVTYNKTKVVFCSPKWSLAVLHILLLHGAARMSLHPRPSSPTLWSLLHCPTPGWEIKTTTVKYITLLCLVDYRNWCALLPTQITRLPI